MNLLIDQGRMLDTEETEELQKAEVIPTFKKDGKRHLVGNIG